MTIAIATIGMLSATTLATGLLLAFTPYLMRRNECFAVTVPASAQSDPHLVALKKQYTLVMSVLTAIATVASLAAGTLLVSGRDAAGIMLLCAALFVPLIASFALMLRNRKKVAELKRAEGWQAQHQQATALAAEEDLPKALPLTWNLLYIPVILATIALGLALYPSMPDMLPMHADFAGNVNEYVPKTIGSAIGFPVLIEAFLAACMMVSHWMILRSKRHADPNAPATSALAYGLFARAESAFLLVAGILISAGIGVVFLLSSAGFMELGQAAALIIILCIPIVIGSIALSVIYGQAGSRVFKRMQASDELLADDDEHWKLGIFYFNKEDASVFLPKRFGVGWTINFSRPAAWAVVIGFAAITAAFLVAVFTLVE